MAKTSLPVRRPLEQPHVAVVVTVLNEIDNITDLVRSLQNQSKAANEVVIVDAGSADGTWENLQILAKEWKNLKVFQKKGNRAVGRNFGVSKTKSPLIAFTDAGCVAKPDWLEELTKPFVDESTQVVSGYYEGRWTTIFEKCQIPYVLVMPDKAGKTEFFPSARSMAIRRKAWDSSRGFDERLQFNEDYELAHHLKFLGHNFVFAPDAKVIWTPRKNLVQVAKMFLMFSIWDIMAGIFRRKVKILAIRYFLFLFFFFLAVEIPILFAPLAGGIVIYLLWSILKNYKYVRDVRAFFWLPVLQITADVTVLFGTIVGALSLITTR